MIDHANAVALVVHDVRKCAEFYRDKLGFSQHELSDDFAYFAFGPKGSAGLALVSLSGIAPELADKARAPAMGDYPEGISRRSSRTPTASMKRFGQEE